MSHSCRNIWPESNISYWPLVCHFWHCHPRSLSVIFEPSNILEVLIPYTERFCNFNLYVLQRLNAGHIGQLPNKNSHSPSIVSLLYRAAVHHQDAILEYSLVQEITLLVILKTYFHHIFEGVMWSSFHTRGTIMLFIKYSLPGKWQGHNCVAGGCQWSRV